MKMVVLCAAAAATLATAIPVSAQVVVRDRDDVIIRDHDRRWHRHHAECWIVRVRTRLPNGNVIIKTRRSC